MGFGLPVKERMLALKLSIRDGTYKPSKISCRQENDVQKKGLYGRVAAVPTLPGSAGGRKDRRGDTTPL
jgi:hypothetical protein